jgi:putative DNA primase/helicase
MSGEKYTRAEVMAIINPEGKVPEKKGKLLKCIYCSDYTESDYGLDITCFRHAEEKWKEHDRKKARAMVSKQSVNKRKTMQSAMRERVDEEQFNGLCRGGCGKMISGEYTCYDCRTKKQREALALKDGETELFRGNIGNPEDKLVKQIVVKDASKIEPDEMTWVWEHRIPTGAITWCLGQPNNAKSLMTIEVAACVTTGRDYPDGAKNTVPPSKVLMYCGEDGLSKIVVPRLMATGADLTKISFLDRKSFRTIAGDNDPQKRPLDLSQDCDVLLELIKQHPDVKMVIVDPITGVFGNKNINKNEEANAVFEQIIDLCEASGIAFLGILHVPKRTTNSAVEKIAGGTAVAGSAKSAFMLSRDLDSDDEHDHVMTMVKWNYTGKTTGLKYRTVPATVEHKGKKFEIAKIEWGEETKDRADDILVRQNSKKDDRDRQEDRCEAFLQTYLAKGAVRSPDVYNAAKQLEFGDTTVRRALKNIKGHHIDRRAQHQGYWMSLTPDFPASEPEILMSVSASEGL